MIDAPTEPIGSVQRWEAACGNFHDEAAGLTQLDSRILETGLFTIMREVCGDLIQPAPYQQDKSMRIDRILFPTTKLLEMGWRHGYVGIEAKKPGEKMGPALAQACDYMRTAFISPRTCARVMLNWVFLYPFERPSGPVESVMAQSRIGTCTPRTRGLCFWASGGALLYASGYGDSVTIRDPDKRKKAGAR